jgi:heat shock protein HtpX
LIRPDDLICENEEPMFKNTMKTAVLLAGLGGLIVMVAGLLGGGSTTSLVIGLGIALVMVGGSFWFSDKLALRSSGATLITEEQAPEFYGMIRDLAQRAEIPMPRVGISPSDQPNAFATGRSPRHAIVVATKGLLETLPAEEVRGVMAHELMHVKHRDILIGSVAAAIATAISFMAQMTIYSSMFGGGRRDRNGNPLIMLAAAILAPIAASLIQMAVSRSREFEADRGAADLLGTGVPLANALRRIDAIAEQRPMVVQPAQASLYIHNPLAEARSSNAGMARMFSTHPSTEERIARLLEVSPAR